MPLDPITLLSQIDPNVPDGATVSAAEVDEYLRQIYGFLRTFLSVAHDDNGALKTDTGLLDANGKVPADRIGDGLVGRQIGSREISAEHLAVVADPATGVLGGGAVQAENINNDQIVARHIADNAVATASLQDSAVTEAKIADASVSAAKIKGVLNAASIPTSTAGVGDGTITAAMLKHDAAYTTPRIPAVTTAVGTNAFATVGGVLSATLEAGVLKFAFSGVFGELAEDLGAVVQTTPPTANLANGIAAVRTGWTVEAGGTWIVIGDEDGTNAEIRITKPGAYLIMVFASVWGAIAAAPGTTTGRVASSLKKGSLADGPLRMFTTISKRTASVTNDMHWHYGAGLVNVNEGGESLYVYTTAEFVDGTWKQSFDGTDRAAMVLIMPVASST